MDIWYEEGIATYGFTPVMTYHEMPNRYINNHASGSGQTMDRNGHYYYVSHPPLAYYLPYLSLIGFGIVPNALSLQSFHIITHLLCILMVYLIAWELLPIKSQGNSLIPLLSACFYMFSAATLWFQTNVYMADTLVQLFYTAMILLLLRMWRKKERSGWLQFYLLVIVFAMCYTHWLGYFVVGTFLTGLLMKSMRLFFSKQVVLPSLVGAGLALGLMIYQYAHIAGLDSYIAEMIHRFSIRSSGQAPSMAGITYDLAALIFNYAANHLVLLLLLIGLGMAVVFKKSIRISIEGVQSVFLFIAFPPLLLLHGILLDYSTHDFTTLYATVGFCGLFAIIGPSVLSVINRQTLVIVCVIVMGLSISQYYYINRPGELSLRGDRYDNHIRRAEQIDQMNTNNQVLFLLNHRPSPQLIYYAERNLYPVEDRQEARQFLHQHDLNNGLLLTIDGQDVSIKERIKMRD